MAYTAGALEPSVQIELERHMVGCEDCRRIAAEQKAVWDALDAWRPATISADFNDRLYRRISEQGAAAWWLRPLRFNWGLRPALPVAAACAAIMVAFLVKEPPRAHRPLAAAQKVSIEQVENALDDVDMLKQMSLTVPVEGHATEPI